MPLQSRDVFFCCCQQHRLVGMHATSIHQALVDHCLEEPGEEGHKKRKLEITRAHTKSLKVGGIRYTSKQVRYKI